MINETPKVLKRPVLLRTVEGEQLVHLAATVETGEVLTYERVLEETKVDLQSASGRQMWRKVQTVLAAEHCMQFACIATVGYKRLDDDAKIDKSGRFIGQAVRRVRAAKGVIVTVDRSKLCAAKQLAHDVQSTVIAVMQTCAKPAIIATRAESPKASEMDKLLESVRALR